LPIGDLRLPVEGWLPKAKALARAAAPFLSGHVFKKSQVLCLGGRLYPKDQPQRATSRETAGLADVLRLVFDTAAVRPDFENTP
jgi:hypothetical protein